MLERVAKSIVGKPWDRLDDFDHKVIITCLVIMGAAIVVMAGAIVEKLLS